MSTPTLRPLRVGEILDAAIKVYLGNARTLIGLTAVVVVPLQLVSAIVLLSTVSTASAVPQGAFGAYSSGSDSAASLGASVVLGVTGVLVSLLTTAGCVKAVSDAYLGGEPGIASSLGFAVRRAVALFGMYIVYVLGLALGFVALIIPGIWLYGAWSVSAPALLIEGRSPVGALARSRQLVRGRWWPAAGVVLVAFVMVGVVGGVLSGALGALVLTGKGSVVVNVIAVSFASAISSVLVRPFQAAVTTVLYYDLRVRRDGYDIALLAEQLGMEPDLPPGLAGAGPESVGQPGGPPFWPPPPDWRPAIDRGEVGSSE